jgi:uncharacterized protein
MTEQVLINSAEFAREGQHLEGQVSLERLARLHDELASTDGMVHYVLQGGLTERREPRIECIINGLVQLVCQRCLGGLAHQITAHSKLILVNNEAQLPALEEEDPSADYIVADPALDVIALVEDEILLALPIAPMHEQGQCVDRPSDAASAGAPSPFAALAKLKVPEQD